MPFPIIDSERPTRVSYLCSVDIFRLSYTVSEIMRFSCKPKMTSSLYLRQGALRTVLDDGIRKNVNGSLSGFNAMFYSVKHRFRGNDVFLPTGNYVMMLYPLGGALRSFNDGFWKVDYGFLVEFHGHFRSIIHRFRENMVFLRTQQT